MVSVEKRLGGALKRLREAFASSKHDHYELTGGKLVRRSGEDVAEAIPTCDIDCWWVDREKVYDVVHIRLRDGRVVDWKDEEYDLLQLLDRSGVECGHEHEPPAKPHETSPQTGQPAA